MKALQHYTNTFPINNIIDLGVDYFNQWKNHWDESLLRMQSNSNSPLAQKRNNSRHVNKKVILMIDDEEVCLLSMELLLTDSNYSLLVANSGQQGIECAKANSDIIDLIFLDLMLPDIYGLEVLTILKNDQKLAKIPVILQTGSSNEHDIQRAYSNGIIECIRKPYKKHTVMNAIKKALDEV